MTIKHLRIKPTNCTYSEAAMTEKNKTVPLTWQRWRHSGCLQPEQVTRSSIVDGEGGMQLRRKLCCSVCELSDLFVVITSSCISILLLFPQISAISPNQGENLKLRVMISCLLLWAEI